MSMLPKNFADFELVLRRRGRTLEKEVDILLEGVGSKAELEEVVSNLTKMYSVSKVAEATIRAAFKAKQEEASVRQKPAVTVVADVADGDDDVVVVKKRRTKKTQATETEPEELDIEQKDVTVDE